ncbi:YbjN domain-containing protein [Hyphomonas pacifica]|uniref:Uncharacterized protein n=1 Tax=Hyphomonas pacifica TaxID=1280941 RepID=A0A062U4Z8_9PROT|nr:YbjN domain-containing protein [Hyphomonas pacifica]KCZ51195.1 hypothetical protein HY2_12180 [Hyphomonas pacifica]RAN33674.1 hypothetical protein HY3_12280 [Hyphomonas pacifica]
MIRILLCGVVAVSIAVPAFAWPIAPENAGKVLTNAGSEEVEVTWLGDDVARLDAKKGEYYYSVRLMNCDDSRTCSSAMFFSTFTMDGAPDFSMYERTNLYNDSYPFGRAFILPSGDDETYAVGVDYGIDLQNEHNFDEEDLNLFEEIIISYTSHMSEED